MSRLLTEFIVVESIGQSTYYWTGSTWTGHPAFAKRFADKGDAQDVAKAVGGCWREESRWVSE